MSEKVFEEMLKELKELNAGLALQRGTVGTSLFEALPFLKGWAYDTDRNPSVITLTRGMGPTRLVTWVPPENIGWTMGGHIIFSDPDTQMRIQMDNATVNTSPRLLNDAGALDFGFIRIESTIFNAAGNPPSFAVSAGFKQPLPFHNLVFFEAWHPDTALTETSYIWFYSFARIFINDKKEWYRSLRNLGRQETLGKEAVPDG